MVNKKFIRCRNCDAVHHVTAFDKAPAYLFSALGPSESTADDWDDFISYGPLNAPARDALLEKCQCCFTTDEAAALRRFIDSHGEADDVLAIVVRRAMAIEPRM